jgi:RHS repeat-associated protein
MSCATKATYDADQCLNCAALSSTCSTPTLTYDVGVAGPGNITSQSGVGTYTYPAAGQPRPHAVTSLTGTFNGITKPSFVYDANGNMTSRAGSTITWSTYNYPTAISANDATGAEEVQLSYGPDRQRCKQIYTAPGTTENTYYVGGLVDMVFSGGVTNYRHYIYAGKEPVAVYSRTSASVNTVSYMLEDHQGGIANIASKSGTSDVNESFSAFGARRNPTTWSGAPTTGDLNTIAGLSRQGYTFQTWLGQSMGLNHMNGRVEDAILGRFLSPDPTIQDPSNAQNYNRYSYVNNNPLTFIDPTGFDALCGNKPCDYANDGGPPADGDDGGSGDGGSGDGGSGDGGSGVGGGDNSGGDPPPSPPTNDGIPDVGCGIPPFGPCYALPPTPAVFSPTPARSSFVGGGGVSKPPNNSKAQSPQTHGYSFKVYTPCYAGDSMSALMSPGQSAPGAPAAHDGTTDITLPPLASSWGGGGQSFLPPDFFTPNPIQQNVSVANGQIANTALGGHIFYPGSVTTTVIPSVFGGSTVQTVGQGSGNYPVLNDVLGFLFFGLRNLSLEIGCNGATQPGI